MNKITVVGAGNVGATTAQRIAEKELAQEVVLLDIVEGLPQGKGLDLNESAPVERYDSRLYGSNSYDDAAGSDIVIMTGGLARKPGMSRDDLLTKNAEIVGGFAEEVVRVAPNAIVILVTNPLDVMVHVAYVKSGFPKERVMGMAGILDTARFRFFIAEEMDVSVEDVSAMVLGGHGDDMVPLARYSTVGGIPLPELMSQETIERLIVRTRGGGAEIVGLLKTGSAFYAPSAAIAEMVAAIAKNKKRILPCAAYLEGQYGLSDVFVGVPVKLGSAGIAEIIEVDLTDDERDSLQESAEHVKASVKNLTL